MADLHDFISDLERSGDLVRVGCPVSPMLEVTEIADRLARTAAPIASTRAGAFDPGREALGGPAVIFENVEGCDFPLAINLFGSYSRMEKALQAADPPGGGGLRGDRRPHRLAGQVGPAEVARRTLGVPCFGSRPHGASRPMPGRRKLTERGGRSSSAPDPEVLAARR